MLFITGPLYSGKRTFAARFGGRQIFDVQTLAAAAPDLEKLADELAAYERDSHTHKGDDEVALEAADRTELFCGLPTVLKGELPEC